MENFRRAIGECHICGRRSSHLHGALKSYGFENALMTCIYCTALFLFAPIVSSLQTKQKRSFFNSSALAISRCGPQLWLWGSSPDKVDVAISDFLKTSQIGFSWQPYYAFRNECPLWTNFILTQKHYVSCCPSWMLSQKNCGLSESENPVWSLAELRGQWCQPYRAQNCHIVCLLCARPMYWLSTFSFPKKKPSVFI